MYGSLATLIGAMFWLYGCIYLILIGLEINVYLMKDTKAEMKGNE